MDIKNEKENNMDNGDGTYERIHSDGSKSVCRKVNEHAYRKNDKLAKNTGINFLLKVYDYKYMENTELKGVDLIPIDSSRNDLPNVEMSRYSDSFVYGKFIKDVPLFSRRKEYCTKDSKIDYYIIDNSALFIALFIGDVNECKWKDSPNKKESKCPYAPSHMWKVIPLLDHFTIEELKEIWKQSYDTSDEEQKYLQELYSSYDYYINPSKIHKKIDEYYKNQHKSQINKYTC